jgi:uridine kinase
MKPMEKIIRKIQAIASEKGKCLVAIDGRCSSGKSTYGEFLAKHLNATLLHMDDFFLRPEQRTPDRYAEAGGNVDRERFIEQILSVMDKSDKIMYQPFDCSVMKLGEVQYLPKKKIVIVEGCYSMHPDMIDYYDFRMFLHVNSEKQMNRIRKRNPDKAEIFRSKWIPLEEKYFKTFRTAKYSDVFIDTSLEW